MAREASSEGAGEGARGAPGGGVRGCSGPPGPPSTSPGSLQQAGGGAAGRAHRAQLSGRPRLLLTPQEPQGSTPPRFLGCPVTTSVPLGAPLGSQPQARIAQEKRSARLDAAAGYAGKPLLESPGSPRPGGGGTACSA